MASSDLLTYLNTQTQIHKVNNAILILPANWNNLNLKTDGYQIIHHNGKSLPEIFHLVRKSSSARGTTQSSNPWYRRIFQRRRNAVLRQIHEQNQHNQLDTYLSLLSNISHYLDAKNASEEVKFFNKKFLQNLGHQIKTPITGVLSGIKLLESSYEDNPQHKDIFGNLYSSCCELATYLNNLLDYYLFTEKRIALELTSYKITPYMKEVFEYYNKKYRDSPNTSIKFIYRHPSDLEIYTDIKRLRQVVMNILDNSFKFTDHGQILVIFETDASNYLIKILDTGCGIAPGDWDKIFFPFYYLTVHNANDRYDGMGISLAISKKIMIMMGGDITIGEPEILNFKTQFTVSIPISKNIASSSLNASRNSTSELRVLPPSPISIMGIANSNPLDSAMIPPKSISNIYPSLMGNNKMEILIIDDNVANTRLTSHLLARILNNYQVPSQIDILNDSREAVSQIIFNKYNIILLDIKMPFMSGIDILTELRNLEFLDGNMMTKIYVSTALTDEVDTKEFENIVVLHKPVLYETFEKIIVDYLAPEDPLILGVEEGYSEKMRKMLNARTEKPHILTPPIVFSEGNWEGVYI